MRAIVLSGALLAAIAGGVLFFAQAEDAPVDEGASAERPLATAQRDVRPEPVAISGPSAPPPGLDAARPTDCLIEPSQVIRVNSGVEGVIETIFVERGDTVSRGQIVAQLKSDVDRAGAAASQARATNVHAVRAAESRAAYLNSVRQRSEQVQQYLAKDTVEEAQSNARAAAEEHRAAAQTQRVAQLEYVQSQRILAEKTVRSPVNGIVTERVMSVGEYRGPDASHILTIAQVDPLNVEVFAPIAQLSSIEVGDEVTIYPEEPVGGRYTARVKVIDRVFDAASGTFGMRLNLPNPGYKLPAGLRCRMEIKSAASAARRGA